MPHGKKGSTSQIPFFAFCFILQKASAIQIDVTAVSGKVVSLPCTIYNSSSGLPVTLVRWFRKQLPKPIYTLDSRMTDVNKTRHFPAPEMDGRAFFDMNLKPPSLWIDPVSVTDQGIYRCHVDFNKGRSVSSTVHLHVIVPPSDVIIVDSAGRKLKGLIGPYNEGEELRLLCRSNGGNPSTKVVWYRGTALAWRNARIRRSLEEEDVMTIPELKRSDFMAQYTCFAFNSNLTEPKTTTVTIDMNLLPLEVKMHVEEKILVSGDAIEVMCECVGSRPKSQITWFKDDQSLEGKESVSDGGRVITNVLTIKLHDDDDGKVLMCQAVNPNIPRSKVHIERRLSVQYRPVVSAYVGRLEVKGTYVEGDEVVLQCSVDSNPRVESVVWLFENQSLSADFTDEATLADTSLIIRPVKRTHAGKYRCSAHNIHGEGSSSDVEIKVLFKPLCRTSDSGPETHKLGRNELANVTCDVHANPKSSSFQWSLRIPMKTKSLKMWVSELSHTTVLLPHDEATHAMTLLCWGINSVGIQESPCVIKLKKIGPPERLHNCRIINRTAQYVAVMCEQGLDGGIPQNFHMEVYNAQSMALKKNLTSSGRPFFAVNGFDPETDFILLLYSSNECGASESESLLLSGVGDANLNKNPYESYIGRFDSPMSILICTILGIPILLVMVFSIVYRWKSRSPIHAAASRKLEPQEKALVSLEVLPNDLSEQIPKSFISGSSTPALEVTNKNSQETREPSSETSLIVE